jgi:hypothetical protein
MHLIEVTPAPCIICGTGNTPGRDGRRQFIDLEVDYNWNDPAIVCEDCGLKIGALLGMLDPAVRADLLAQVRRAELDQHKAEADRDAMRRRARRLGMEFVEPEEAVA